MKQRCLRSQTPVGARVLLLGDRPAVALTACRALSGAGHYVGVTGSRALDVVGLSRHASRYHRIPPIDGPVGAWSDAIRNLVNEGGYDLVIATSDGGVARLLSLDVGVPTCPEISDQHLSLIDKGQLASLCASALVDYPRTARPQTLEQDEAMSRGIAGPTIVKSARSAVATRDGLLLAPGAHEVHDYLTASRALASIRARGLEPVVQEHIFGEKLQGVIIRRGGSTSFRMAFRVRREFPPRGGKETMLERLHTDVGFGAEICAILERLADAVSYEGILQAEFYMTVSGRISVIDVNPRLWGSLAYAELLGLKMMRRIVRDTLRLEPDPPPEVRIDRRYHHLVRELRWSGARPRAISQIIATASVRDVWDTPSMTDPLPELFWLARRLVHARRMPAKSQP